MLFHRWGGLVCKGERGKQRESERREGEREGMGGKKRSGGEEGKGLVCFVSLINSIPFLSLSFF